MPETITGLAQIIQISVAPVFLLTGIAGILSVMTHRLARIIDRARSLEAARPEVVDHDRVWDEELRTLRSRMNMINRGIALCTYSALAVAAVIAALFLGALLEFDLTPAVALSFVVAMLLLIGGLVSFLGEVHLATRWMRQTAR
jgi:hypothetical protein